VKQACFQTHLLPMFLTDVAVVQNRPRPVLLQLFAAPAELDRSGVRLA